MKDYQHNDNKEEVILSRVNFCNSCSLKKENEELKEKLNAWEYGSPIIELETENAELKKDKEYLDKVNNEQTGVILKLNEQIEKMKCCGNCSKKHQCEMNVIDSLHCDKWGLAE